nr:immunoglobulin light chain junction region [Macaca mulatta]
CYQYSSGRAF